ncbi:AAA family ATPase [Sinorhizobium medicae]|nr:AAA family ATPase [Sinorhizobium meliloti]MDX0492504.1 AAA family ATPase [Sinorhizobium medicae]
MACKVHYLSSAGIQKSEVAGVEALARVYPSNWLLYCSLNAFPRNSAPIEIDVLLVMDDRILLLELKEWNGTLTSEGDIWILNGRPQGRSPVVLGNEKARKIKGIIKDSIPRLSKTYVDSRVVLTGSATKELLPAHEQQLVLNLSEAQQIADPKQRGKLLSSVQFSNVKPNMFVKEFDKLLGNPRYFEPRKKNWDGYVVADEDFFVHRRGIWREHLAQLAKDERIKGLLRLWRFDQLPVGLNSLVTRQLIGDRELSVSAYLKDSRSWLGERGILTATGTPPDEVLTQHYQVLAIPSGWTTLRRYLERVGEELPGEHRVDAMHTLVSLVAELHKNGVSHRDLGADCIWVGSPTDMALTSFACATVPDQNSVEEWIDVLGTYSEQEPSDQEKPTAMERDVRSLGLVIEQIGRVAKDDGTIPDGWQEIASKAVGPPAERYSNAIELADAIGELRNPSGPIVDQSRLDAFETNTIPYVDWLPLSKPLNNGRSSRYQSHTKDGARVIVKVWNGMVRGDAQRDHSMLAMLEAASAIAAVPVPGIAPVMGYGLSPVGPFLVTRFVEGVPLDQLGTVPVSDLLQILSNLFAAVSSLHARGLAHGDLHPGQVIIGAGNSVVLIDLLDISAVGSPIRSEKYSPANHERRSNEQIDRYACCRIALDLCERGGDDLEDVGTALRAELSRDVIETLSPVEEAVSKTVQRLTAPRRREFQIRLPDANVDALEADNGRLWVYRYEPSANIHAIFIEGLRHGLLLRFVDGSLSNHEVYETKFERLGRGTPLEISINIRPGDFAGIQELLNFVVSAVNAEAQVDEAAAGFDREETTEDELEEIESLEVTTLPTEELPAASARLGNIDIPQLWQRSAELEEDAVQTISLGRRLADAGNSAVFRYTSSRQLEFDDDDVVEIRLGRGVQGRRVGFLDVSKCSDTEVAIRDLRTSVAEGETFSLVDKRDRISKERRRRAIDRITTGKSVIPHLIDFFDPDRTAATQDFEVDVKDDDLIAYGLNAGQRKAFRTLLEQGPVGLLQGPPGSGKTRFIAAFVHWLLAKGGARRILIASQSHEAVNNALEELLRTYREHGGHANLLRVGSRGSTERVRPYQARSLRDRYRIRFENGMRSRIATAASSFGISRDFTYEVVDVHRRLGSIASQLELVHAAGTLTDATPDDIRRANARANNLSKSFNEIAESIIGRPTNVEEEGGAALLEIAYRSLLNKYPKTTPSDLVKVRQILGLAVDWVDTLRSGHRNFDEFLAKTRSVVAGTCVGLGQSQIRLESGVFDWVIVDEAARCTHGELAVPLQVGSRVVLVGDQRQLRPMVDREVVNGLSQELPRVRLAEIRRSDFERAFISSYGRKNARVLDEQYRMTPVISDLVSRIFYAPHGVTLRPAEDRKPDEVFSDLEGLLKPKVVWFDTAKAPGSDEQVLNEGRDFWNEAEVEGVMSLLERLAIETDLSGPLASRQDPSIGIICMYSEQKRQIERAWFQQHFPDSFRRIVTIDTVDAYQGKQNSIVIITLVRSNGDLKPGHVVSENRCNVALSRAKERLYIFGSTRMWGHARQSSPMSKVLKHILKLEQNDGRVVNVEELQG